MRNRDFRDSFDATRDHFRPLHVAIAVIAMAGCGGQAESMVAARGKHLLRQVGESRLIEVARDVQNGDSTVPRDLANAGVLSARRHGVGILLVMFEDDKYQTGVYVAIDSSAEAPEDGSGQSFTRLGDVTYWGVIKNRTAIPESVREELQNRGDAEAQ